jgi:LL-H family phage holin
MIMDKEIFLMVLEVVLTLAVAVITGVVVPYVRSKIETDKLSKLDYYVKLGIRSAEQIFDGDGKGEEKKKYVVNYITEIINRNLKIDITPEELDTIIEGMVNNVKYPYGK